MTDLPSDEVRAELARASLENARRLMEDAETLRDTGSVPTAFALAVLAVEEVGKAMICGKADLGTRRDFLRRIHSHEEKLTAAHHAPQLLMALVALFKGESAPGGAGDDEFWERLADLAQSDHARKMSGLYVDLSDTDTIEELGAEIDDEEADAAIEIACIAIAVAEGPR